MTKVPAKSGCVARFSYSGVTAEDGIITERCFPGDTVLVVTASRSAGIGEVDVEMYGAAGEGHADYVRAVRGFAEHLLRYASDYAAAWEEEKDEEDEEEQCT